jgi:hypothetical protein
MKDDPFTGCQKIEGLVMHAGVRGCLQLLENGVCQNLGSKNTGTASEAVQGFVSEENFGFYEAGPETFPLRSVTGNEMGILHWSPECSYNGNIIIQLLSRSFRHNHPLKRSWQWCSGIWREFYSWSTCYTRQQSLGHMLLHFRI